MEENSVNVRSAVPFFMVTDMKKSLEFYIAGLGFEIKNTWEPNGKTEWCWLQLGNASVMLQEYRNLPSSDHQGKGVSIYFMCENALVIYHDITSRGIAAEEPFVGNGMWVIGMQDPDGYHLLFESVTDVPEGTNYSEWLKN